VTPDQRLTPVSEGGFRDTVWLPKKQAVNLETRAGGGDVASKDEKAERKRLKDEYLRAQQAESAARMPLARPQLEAFVGAR
jgi:hypothetical protein